MMLHRTMRVNSGLDTRPPSGHHFLLEGKPDAPQLFISITVSDIP